MPLPDQQSQQSKYGEGGGSDYSGDETGEVSVEEKRIRQELANKISTIASQIEVSSKAILLLIDTKYKIIGNKKYFVLTKEQEEEFNREFGNINRLIGEAETMSTDLYLELKGAPDVIKRSKNKYFYLRGIIKDHVDYKGRCYQYHADTYNHFIYPYYKLGNGIKDLMDILSELRGHLNAGAEFLKDVIYLVGAGGGGNGSSDYYSGRSYGYPRNPSQVYGTNYDEFGRRISPEHEAPKMRAIGDEADKG